MPRLRAILVLVLLLGGCLRLGFDQEKLAGTDGAADAPHQGPEVGLVDQAPAERPAPDAMIGSDATPLDGPVLDAPKLDAPKLDAAPPDAAPPDTKPPPDTSVVAGGFKPVSKGTFVMGSPSSEPCREASNEQMHQVILTHNFEIEALEVSQAAFQALMGYNPSYTGGCTTCPVERVSWHEAAAYCAKLSTSKGLTPCYTCTGTQASTQCADAPAYAGYQIYTCPGYRLPTEAEWERAYRAGAATALYNGGVDATKCTSCASSDLNAAAIAWYCVNAGGKPQPGGLKGANKHGLHDMAGNVWEWVHDRYQASLGSSSVFDPWGAATGTTRVMRGGSYNSYLQVLRAAFRGYVTSTYRMVDVGFRCARTVTP